MEQVLTFLTGPGLVISLSVFFIGLITRLVLYFKGLNWRLERVAYRPHMARGMQGGLYSIGRWLIPFGTCGWRAQPFMTTCFFLLHFGAVLVPLFLTGHNELLSMKFGFSLPSLPQGVADVLTIGTLVGLALITLRRIALAKVRILTTAYDYFILLLVAVPFVTGFVARLGTANYDTWLLVHILSGQLMLILAPFTKLSHIALYFASRWQIGADFGIKRGGAYRGPCFPW
jgi:Nitrate reductase gamma subunit